VFAWIFFNLFEIVEDERRLPPSREAQVNEYLALDRWLRKDGLMVRVETEGDIHTLRSAAEGTILIQSELFDWDTEAIEYLETWVEKGGFLILCLGYYRAWDDDALGGFLNRLGLEADTSWSDTGFVYYSESDPQNPAEPRQSVSEVPFFGRNIRFKAPPLRIDEEEETALILKDENDVIRLVQVSRGRGKITVTGRPRFMTSSRLKEEPNARLSWYLLAGEGRDILFIRGERRGQHIMGRIFQLGNFRGVVISAIVLIIVGFWSVVPRFGVVKGNNERKGKTLTERFHAEGEFFKRFGALDVYQTQYFREIRRRLMKKEHLSDEEVLARAVQLLHPRNYEEMREIEQVLLYGPKNKKDFLKSVVIHKTILERI
jgi:hypothetical protein